MENLLQIKLAVRPASSRKLRAPGNGFTRIMLLILVKPFPGARTKAMKHYVSPDLEKKPDLVILHTGTNDLKSVSSPEEIANQITSLALSVKEKGHQIAVSGILPQGDMFSKTAKDVNECLEIECKGHKCRLH